MSQVVIPHLILLSNLHVAVKIAAIAVSAASLAYEALMAYTFKEIDHKSKDDILCITGGVVGLHYVSALALAVYKPYSIMVNPLMIFPALGMVLISMTGVHVK